MLATEGSYALWCSTIEEGGLVIAYVSPRVMRAVYVRSEADHVVQFTTGTYHTSDWIGMQYGCGVFPRKRRENATPLYLLRPTPELWTRVLHHRTQILYLADISMICTFLELKPGSVVLESGTGSGSLTHALARAVAPNGHVHTFEFHSDRCTSAAEEFQKHSIDAHVTIQQRDVQSMGFPEAFLGKAHGVFLDLPEPWRAIGSAVACVMPGHCLMTFSPCIEQIQRTCQTLRDTEQMTDIRIMECISREYRVKSEAVSMDLNHHHELLSQGTPPTTRHTNVLSLGSQPGNKRKEQDERSSATGVPVIESQGRQERSAGGVVNARVVDMKGHTGFLIVARRFANGPLSL